jgi:hypothetical protein
MKKILMIALSTVAMLAALAMGGGQATSNFGSAFYPAAVAITGGTMSGVTITNSPISGSTVSGTTVTASGVVSGASFASSQAAVLTAGAALGSSPVIGCYGGGWTCNANYGYIGITVGTTPIAGNVAVISWTTGFNHPAVCTFNGYDNTAGANLTTISQNNGTASATSATIYTSSAITTAHTLAIQYVCM